MSVADPALVEINGKHRDFWAQQKVLMQQRMADEAIFETAVEEIDSEANRQVPVRSQKSWEGALQDAEGKKRRFTRQQAQAGGKAAKTNPLQELINSIVRNNPRIDARGLLDELRRQRGDGIIDDIDEGGIYFKDAGSIQPSHTTAGLAQDEIPARKTISYYCPVSALKHRLTRARKKNRQEHQSR